MQFYIGWPIRTKLATCLGGHTALLIANLKSSILSHIEGGKVGWLYLLLLFSSISCCLIVCKSNHSIKLGHTHERTPLCMHGAPA